MHVPIAPYSLARPQTHRVLDTGIIMNSFFELQDELQALQDPSSYEIANEHDLHDVDAHQLLHRTFVPFASNHF